MKQFVFIFRGVHLNDIFHSEFYKLKGREWWDLEDLSPEIFEVGCDGLLLYIRDIQPFILHCAWGARCSLCLADTVVASVESVSVSSVDCAFLYCGFGRWSDFNLCISVKSFFDLDVLIESSKGFLLHSVLLLQVAAEL